MLNGWKTYIVSGLIGIVTVLHSTGKLDTHWYATLLGLLGAGGLAATRHGITTETHKAVAQAYRDGEEFTP